MSRLPLLEDRNARFDFRKEENLAGKKHFFFGGPTKGLTDHVFDTALFCSAASCTVSVHTLHHLHGHSWVIAQRRRWKFFPEIRNTVDGRKRICWDKQKLEKHAAELATANTQVALVAAALESIKSALTELKTDVKEWMRNHTPHNNAE
jgi:hypothetical protein